MDVSRHDPEPKPSTQPVERSQSQPDEQPRPMDATDAPQESLKVISIDQGDPKAYE
jgi:hypothetical protein